jgi:hypothetical protein
MSTALEAIAEDVFYEWDMFRWSFGKLREHGYSVGTGRINDQETSATLESFLLHTRTLRDFLCDDKKKWTDDVLAHDFFKETPGQWTKARPPLGPYLSQNKERLNKMLAHISYARLGFKAQDEWDIGAVLHELDVIWKAFLKALSPEKRKWFEGN